MLLLVLVVACCCCGWLEVGYDRLGCVSVTSSSDGLLVVVVRDQLAWRVIN